MTTALLARRFAAIAEPMTKELKMGLSYDFSAVVNQEELCIDRFTKESLPKEFEEFQAEDEGRGGGHVVRAG